MKSPISLLLFLVVYASPAPIKASESAGDNVTPQKRHVNPFSALNPSIPLQTHICSEATSRLSQRQVRLNLRTASNLKNFYERLDHLILNNPNSTERIVLSLDIPNTIDGAIDDEVVIELIRQLEDCRGEFGTKHIGPYSLTTKNEIQSQTTARIALTYTWIIQDRVDVETLKKALPRLVNLGVSFYEKVYAENDFPQMPPKLEDRLEIQSAFQQIMTSKIPSLASVYPANHGAGIVISVNPEDFLSDKHKNIQQIGGALSKLKIAPQIRSRILVGDISVMSFSLVQKLLFPDPYGRGHRVNKIFVHPIEFQLRPNTSPDTTRALIEEIEQLGFDCRYKSKEDKTWICDEDRSMPFERKNLGRALVEVLSTSPHIVNISLSERN